jgi:hypothetical protein
MSYAGLGSGGGGAWEFISTATISDQATVDIALTGTHKMFVLHIDNLIPATDATEDLWLRFSTDLGSTFLAGVSDYAWSNRGADGLTDLFIEGGDETNQIVLTRSVTRFLGNTAGESLNGFVYIHNANQTTKAVVVTTDMAYVDHNADIVTLQTRAALIANIDEVDEVRFMASSGNLTSGRISLYGVNDAS